MTARDMLREDGRRRPLTVTRAWTYAALVIAMLVGTSAGVHAGLINQDTGEIYIPSVDENGDVEDPPDWVPQVGGQVRFEPQTVVDQDYCDSAVDEWLDNDDDRAVSDAMTDAATRDELFQTIET
jgi:hypothetical protein